MADRPMLGATFEETMYERHKYKWFPGFVQPKYDGIRCLIKDNRAYSRTMKLVPNYWVQRSISEACIKHPLLNGFDGELMVVDDNEKYLSYNEIQSAIMSEDGRPNFRFVAFDHHAYPDLPFIRRMKLLFHSDFDHIYWLNISAMHKVGSLEEIYALHTKYTTEHNYEGVVFRSAAAPYKSGRATLTQAQLVKFKEFVDDEGPIIGWEEKLHNNNPLERDALGLAKRSAHKENKMPSGTLGAFILQWKGTTVNVGSGFTQAQREEYWEKREQLKGRWVKFKYFPHGMQDRPRHPIFLGFRHLEDM